MYVGEYGDEGERKILCLRAAGGKATSYQASGAPGMILVTDDSKWGNSVARQEDPKAVNQIKLSWKDLD